MMVFGIAAGWISSAGLALDIVGFGLIASDIYAALSSEGRSNAARYMAQHAIEGSRGWGGGQPVSPPTFGLSEAIMAESRSDAAVLDRRGWKVAFGIGFVVLGFILQLFGSLPELPWW